MYAEGFPAGQEIPLWNERQLRPVVIVPVPPRPLGDSRLPVGPHQLRRRYIGWLRHGPAQRLQGFAQRFLRREPITQHKRLDGIRVL